jgi:hypothetical protein
MVGQTNSFGAGNQDFYIVKLDSSGTLQWTRTIGGTNIEFAYSLHKTPMAVILRADLPTLLEPVSMMCTL